MEPLGLALISVCIGAYCLVSRRLAETVVTAPMVFSMLGLALSGSGLAALDPGHGVVHGLAEATLILVLFSDAARINLRGLGADHSLPVRLLGVGMPLTIIVGTLLGLALPLGLGLFEAALLATLLAPTDAALGQAVVSSPRVPARVRQALNVESGLNDGVALPIVLVLAACAGAAHAGDDERNWALFAMTQVTLGPLVGASVGALGAAAILASARHGWLDEAFEGAAVLAIAVMAFAGAEAIGGNGFISAFVSGIVFGARAAARCRFLFSFAEAEGHLLVLLTFLVFGAALLPLGIAVFDIWVLLYALLSLTVVRMAPVALALTGARLNVSTVAFLGWFGPRGLASILFGLLVLEELGGDGADRVLAITVATVGLSILLHGATAAPFARRYADHAARMRDCEENMPVDTLPTRTPGRTRTT